jgi:hypothetical protein
MTGSDQVPRGLVRLAKKRRAPRCHPPCSGNLLPQRFLGSTWGTRTRSEGNQTNPGCILIVPRCDSQTTALLQARLRMQVRKPGREDSQTKNMFVPMYLLGFLCAASTTRHLQPESPRHNVGATLIVLATLISHAQPKLLLLCRYLHKQVSTLAPHSSDCFTPELQPKSRLQTVKGARPTWVFDVAAAGVEMPSSFQSSGGQPGDSQGGPRINGTSTRARNDPHLSI